MNKLGPFTLNRVHHGDCLKLIKKIPDNSVDLILTDPPFAIGFKAKKANYNRQADKVVEGYQEIPEEEYSAFSLRWIQQCHCVLKDTGNVYIFSGWNNLKDILNAAHQAGFITLNHLIWKYQFGVFTKKKFVTSHYHILLLVKDLKKYYFNKIEHYPEDVIFINREYWTGKTKTPTKLPTKLVEKLIQYSSRPNDLVLDPFMGSGTTAFVSKNLKRNFLGFEIVPDYVKFARERLKEIRTNQEKNYFL